MRGDSGAWEIEKKESKNPGMRKKHEWKERGRGVALRKGGKGGDDNSGRSVVGGLWSINQSIKCQSASESATQLRAISISELITPFVHRYIHIQSDHRIHNGTCWRVRAERMKRAE